MPNQNQILGGILLENIDSAKYDLIKNKDRNKFFFEKVKFQAEILRN
jgi:hypothetical protein